MSHQNKSNGTSGSLRAESVEDVEMFEKMFRLVMRSFYDDKFVVIAEQVYRWTMLPADVLAGRLGITTKDLAVLCSKLVEDKIICHFKRAEKKEGVDSRLFQRNYYYMHPPLFLGMLKYRLHHLRLKLDSSIISSTYTTSFICPQCRFTYSTLDVAHLLDLTTNTLRCERPGCGEELKEDEEEGLETKKSKIRMRKFNEQCSSIIRALEVLEKVKVSYIDPAEFIADSRNHTWKSLKAEQRYNGAGVSFNGGLLGQDSTDFSSLPDSKTTSMSDVSMPNISLTDANTSAAALKAAQEEADRQRKENAIPEWLSKSTVSGQETALGIKDRRARELHEQRSLTTGGGAAGGDSAQDGENEEDDYYAQYAKLQEQEEQEREAKRKRQRSEEVKSEEAKRVKVESDVKKEEPSSSSTTTKHEKDVDVGEIEEDEDDLEDVA
ncbi:unnamed protein product [Sympodiomycopsis kandeliae]